MLSSFSHLDPEQASILTGPRATYGSFGERKLALLCDGLRLPRPFAAKALDVFRLLSHSWSNRPLQATPWRNDITDDGSPFEFSVAYDGGAPKLRMLVESQQPPMNVVSSWNAGVRLNESLRHLPDVDLARFERVQDLFAPLRRVPARCALWHAVVIDNDLRAMYKVYLNPQVRGGEAALGITTEALARLGMTGAVNFLRSPERPIRGEHLLFFSLDLSASDGARAKVYIAHPGVRSDEIDPALAGTSGYVRGEGERWIRQLLGTNGPFERRPILTCVSFTGSGRIPLGTLHVPVRDYVSHDAHSVERACEFLGRQDGARFRRAMTAFACRPLESGRSMLTYISLRRAPHGLNTTIYIAPEAFAVSPPTAPASPPRSLGRQPAVVRPAHSSEHATPRWRASAEAVPRVAIRPCAGP